MRSFVFLLVVLGVFALLAVQYSFWVAAGVMQFGSMLAITVIAFSVRSKQAATTGLWVTDDDPETGPVEDQTASKGLKAYEN